MEVASHNKERVFKIKPKVILGFTFLLLIAVAAVAITFLGFVDLISTRQSLTKPSIKLVMLNSTLTDIYEAESNIRAYTLTQNQAQLREYFLFLTRVNSKVDSLDLLTKEDTVQNEQIKFIKKLLWRKKKVLNDYIALKETDWSKEFFHLAMSEIERLETDSVLRDAVITRTTTTRTSKRDTLIKKQPQEAPGFFGRLKGWFTGNSATDSTATLLHVEEKIRIDTLKHSWVPTDSLLRDVLKILSQIRTRQEETISKLSAKELELLQTDLKLMDEIRSVVSMLEREELVSTYNRAENARKVVNRSTFIILSLGGIALILTIIFIVVIFRDVSRSNFYRKQLVEAREYAEKLLTIKEQFLANMSHEIRTPLSAIIGFSKQLRESPLSENQTEYVNSLEFSSELLLDIINDLLDLSKIEGGHLKLENIPFYPCRIIKESVALFEPKAKDKGLQLIYSSTSNPETAVVGDPFRLKQMIINLVANAIKFTQEGKVEVTISQSETSAKTIQYNITISDTGIGIDPVNINNIFERFNQAETGITRRFGGTGLGLTIIKNLAELHNGSIEVESKLGEGSIFVLKLPYTLSSEMPLSDTSIIPLTPSLPAKLQILVVDDDPLLLRLTKTMINKLGVEPVIFGSPNLAIEALEKTQFDVVLSDIQMPEISGYDLVKRLRELDKPQGHTWAIAITANNFSENIQQYTNAGFDGVLLKPFNEFTLYNSIASLLNLEEVSGIGYPEDDSMGKPFDLTDVKRFCEGDEQALAAVLQSIVSNNSRNIELLQQYAEIEDWKGVQEVTHRMKSAMGQIGAYEILSMVRDVELLPPEPSSLPMLKNLIEAMAKAFTEIEGQIVQKNY
jgi:signal transduction histidine kinase/CheY-like chemotaxis protein